MAFKDLLVHLDGTEQSEARLKTAVNLASRHEAHLIAVYVIPNPFIPVYDTAQIPAEYFESQLAGAKEKSDRVEKSFNAAIEHAGISGEWRCEQGLPVDVILKHTRYCDLLVVGQRDPNGPPEFADLPDSLILTAGRPVLVIPYALTEHEVGHRVMVAWNSSAQAARAINDAMPFLEQADQVNVIAINPAYGNSAHGEIPCADISLHLARHHVKAEAQSISVSDVGVADMLLSRAADKSADLFVMGAYGHARWRELVLGGVTAHMLEHMTVPVFMAH